MCKPLLKCLSKDFTLFDLDDSLALQSVVRREQGVGGSPYFI